MTTPPTPHRTRGTKRGVHMRDRLASIGISFGGIAVLAAVLGIGAYLVWVVVPLFRSGSASARAPGTAPRAAALRVLDEHQQVLASIGWDGIIRVTELATGAPVTESPLGPPDRRMTACAALPGGEFIAVGFGDGSVRIGSIRFEAGPLAVGGPAPEPGVRRLKWGAAPVIDPAGGTPGVVSLAESGDWRATAARIEFNAPISSDAGPVRALDVARTPDGHKLLLIARDSGAVSLSQIIERRPLGGGPPRITLAQRDVAAEPGPAPARWLVAGDGAGLLAVFDDLSCVRYAPDQHARFVPVERARLGSPGRRLGCLSTLLGDLTFLVADDAGRVQGFTIVRDPGAPGDGRRLRPSHTFRERGPVVLAMSASPRDRAFALALETGEILVVHGTSEKHLARLVAPEPPADVLIAPRNDGVLAFHASGAVSRWRLDMGYGEVSLRSVFGPMVYEGEPRPSYVYQSSGGASEPKLSLIPLIFGTLKATIFAMLFAGPVAVLAAVHTSEFCTPRARRLIKPAIELMASLPSVVLGFVAAIVLAPLVAEHLAWLLTGLVLVPMVVMAGAWVWGSLPEHRTRGLTGAKLLGVVLVLLLGGAWASRSVGAGVERLLFAPSETDLALLTGRVEPVETPPAWFGSRTEASPADLRRLARGGLGFQGGAVVRARPPEAPAEREAWRDEISRARVGQPSFRRWLDGAIARPTPGWIVLLAPLGVLGGFAAGSFAVRRVRSPGAQGLLLRAGVGCAAALSGGALAWLLALALVRAGLDPRESVFGPFSMRNTLVVGVIMGFAIIPIIYTISEDAMRSVPDALRLASLGAGATPWQTTLRVVVPVAASGIFSACMIGLGRAVGETMIVLMATGATPEINWNIFAGFRTLAANIAIELPEARAGSAHYRLLFLCGLVLFAFTIIINSCAELVRRRVRARIAGL